MRGCYCTAKCHTHCSLVEEEEVRELKLFAVCGGRQTTRGSVAECIEVGLIKAITQSTCLISSIRGQMKKITKHAALCGSN